MRQNETLDNDVNNTHTLDDELAALAILRETQRAQAEQHAAAFEVGHTPDEAPTGEEASNE